jgi:hypothetical protein
VIAGQRIDGLHPESGPAIVFFGCNVFAVYMIAVATKTLNYVVMAGHGPNGLQWSNGRAIIFSVASANWFTSVTWQPKLSKLVKRISVLQFAEICNA